MITKFKKNLKLGTILSMPLIFLPVAVVSCSKNKVKDNNKSQKFYHIKNKIDKLNWESDFLLAKKFKEKKLNYKEYTYESFFEFTDDSLLSLKNIELSKETELLNTKKSKIIDTNEIKNKYLSNNVINEIDLYNKNVKEEEKLVLLFRTQKLDPSESAILIWVWLTEKKYLKETNEISNLKYFSLKKIVLYGHWFYNEKYNKNNKNKTWEILSYTVPTISIIGLILYIVTMVLIKRKKTANKKFKKRNIK